ncbi:hypothetical protein KCU65_g749, partial [Aureobasidium melanogenum]
MVSTVTTASNDPSSTNLQAPIFVDKPERQSPRPSFTSSRPSWIGPQQAARSIGFSKMAQKEEIHYSHPGLQPPVFIAGSMCEPQWEPIEMKYNDKEDGELEFKHEFEAEPGEYQYKFRLGPGDWWVLDETKPTVDDGTGIRNNLLVVERKSQQPQLSQPHEAEVEQPSQEKDVPASIQVADIQEKQTEPVDDMNDDDDIPESEKNLFRHETVQEPEGTGESDHEDEDIEIDDEQAEEPPLFEHEAGPFQRVDSQFGTPSKTNNFEFDNVTDSPIEVDDFAVDESDAPCPLFRHETGASHDLDPDEAPLFAHESMSPVMSATTFSPKSRKQRKPDLEDVNDPSLEPFPVDEAGIQARLQRVATRHQDDEVVFEGTPPSPSLAQTKSFSPQVRPDLTHMESNDLSHLDAIDETEETDEELIEEPAEKKGSLVQPTPINIKVQDVSEIASNPTFTDVPDVSNRGPPTPPMTPTEHARASDGAADSKEMPVPVASPRSREDNVTDHISNRPAPSEGSKAVKSSKPKDAELSLASKACIWFIGLCGGKVRAAGAAIAMGVAAVAFAFNTRSA